MRFRRGLVSSVISGVVLALAIGPKAVAQSSPEPAPRSDLVQMLEEARADIAEQKRRLAEQEERLRRHEAYVRSLSQRANGVVVPSSYGNPGSTDARQIPQDRYAQREPEPVAPTPPRGPRTSEPAPQEDRPESERPPEQLLVERGGILLPEGTIQVEPSIQYTHISSSRVAISGFTIFDAIVIGSIRVDDLQRDIVTAALSGRYGFTDRIQLEGRVPYVYRQDDEILGVGTSDERERSVNGYGIGDAEFSVAYQALTQQGALPATVLRARGRFPTGTNPFEIERETVAPGGETRLTEAPTGNGFYGAGLSSTFVWRADPAVFFAGGSYTRNFARTFDEFGEIDPGDTYQWFVGLNFALSEALSINLSFDNQITETSTQNGTDSPGTSSNDARLQLGASVALSNSTSLLVSTSVGLTEESPDFLFTLSLPITFR